MCSLSVGRKIIIAASLVNAETLSKVIRMHGVPPLLVKNRALVLSDFK